MRFTGWAFIGILAFIAVESSGANAPASQPDDVRKIVASLNYKTGQINLRDGLAKLTISDKYRYLDAADARKILVDLWGNPPSNADCLGLIMPAKANPLERNCWVVIITWNEEGYVRDDDAEKINYDELLKDMQEATKKTSDERAKQGYDAVQLVGWAMPPRYDRQTHQLYWAKNLKFDGGTSNTLNYCVRSLGRRGVLQLNAVANMDQLQEVSQATPEFLGMVDFNQGNRYVDFNPSTDKTASYGLAALVAGGIAAKVGLFKGLWLALLAAKKFIIIGAVALVAALRKGIAKLFGRK